MNSISKVQSLTNDHLSSENWRSYSSIQNRAHLKTYQFKCDIDATLRDLNSTIATMTVMLKVIEKDISREKMVIMKGAIDVMKDVADRLSIAG